MAEVPDRILECFITQTINKAGIYLMKFWVNGIETPVIVDDYLPVRKGKNSLAFASSKGEEELWLSLLEKGWAKLHGNYSRIEGGQPIQAAIHMMGTPSSSVTHADLKTDELKKVFWY